MYKDFFNFFHLKQDKYIRNINAVSQETIRIYMERIQRIPRLRPTIAQLESDVVRAESIGTPVQTDNCMVSENIR